MNDWIIDIQNVDYHYQSYTGDSPHKALDHVSIQIKKGEFLAILGHNGSGKSTLAKLMNGLLLPTTGKILVNGLDTKDEQRIWDIRKTCGMVFQNPDNQLVATIVEEDVAFGPENLGVPMPELMERVDQALALVEMSDYRRHSPHLLSGGQKQRIAIAGILAMNPECIILDEPTAMLDPNGREEIISTISRLHQEQQKTIVYITHYMKEVVAADRLIVLNRGKISLEGTPREVFANVEKMKELGLDVPQVTELAYHLKSAGFLNRNDYLTVEELVEAL